MVFRFFIVVGRFKMFLRGLQKVLRCDYWICLMNLGRVRALISTQKRIK
jgi:hypothetical protein